MSIGIVTAKCGKMQGIELEGKYEGITVFKGIPYAKPPVGELRWKPPVDIEPWEGTRVCDTFGDMCIQLVDKDDGTPSLSKDEYSYNGLPNMSEDCLYLNVCTGASGSDEKRPVYLWLHGGGLTNGYAYEPEFDPSELARKGVIVVTAGHRLGAFGYISLPQLTAEQGKSGNYGLMDTVKALDWVYDNIGAFGGDPERITVGGQSGGTWKVSALATCPLAKKRVRRAITESWMMWMMEYYSLEKSEQIGQDFLGYCGIDPNTPLEELRKMDASAFNVPMRRDLIPGDMYFDGEYVPYPTQFEAYEKLGDNIDFICGTNLGEANVYAPKDLPETFYAHYKAAHEIGIEYTEDQKITTPEKFYEHFRDVLGDLYDKYDFEHLVPVTEKDNIWRITRQLATLGLTRKFIIGLTRSIIMDRIFGMYMKNKYPKNKVFAYLWSHLQPVRPEDYGTYRDPDMLLAWHSSELWYFFGSLREGTPPKRPWQEADYKIADTITSFWANFMATGDPNGPGLPEWPSAGNNFGYIELNDDMKSYIGLDSKLDKLIYEFALREHASLQKEKLD